MSLLVNSNFIMQHKDLLQDTISPYLQALKKSLSAHTLLYFFNFDTMFSLNFDTCPTLHPQMQVHGHFPSIPLSR